MEEKLVKIFLMFLLFLTLSSCGRLNRWMQGFTGNAQEVCHKGVAYVQFVSGASVAYNKDGSLISCVE